MKKTISMLATLLLICVLAAGIFEGLPVTASASELTGPCQHNYQYMELDEDTHARVCSLCGDKTVEDHTWDKGTVTRKPTCQQTGRKLVTCTGCGATEEKSINRLPHEGTYENLQAEGHRFTCSKCNEVSIESHGYKNDWEINQEEHYRICADCGYQRDKAAHVPGELPTETTSQTCTVCGVVLKEVKNHDHTYGDQPEADEENHWYKCLECEATKDLLPHEYDDDCDEDCNVCEMLREAPHSFDSWQSDNTNHWKACSLCGKKIEEAAHTFAGEGIPECSVCGQQSMANHQHDFSAHTHTCDCGESKNGTAQFCEVCGTFPWGLLCAAEAVLFAGILLFVIQKNKPSDELEDPEEEAPEEASTEETSPDEPEEEETEDTDAWL